MDGIELESWNRQSSNIELRHGQHRIALSRLWLAAPHFKSELKHQTRLGTPQTDAFGRRRPLLVLNRVLDFYSNAQCEYEF